MYPLMPGLPQRSASQFHAGNPWLPCWNSSNARSIDTAREKKTRRRGEGGKKERKKKHPQKTPKGEMRCEPLQTQTENKKCETKPKIVEAERN